MFDFIYELYRNHMKEIPCRRKRNLVEKDDWYAAERLPRFGYVIIRFEEEIIILQLRKLVEWAFEFPFLYADNVFFFSLGNIEI